MKRALVVGDSVVIRPDAVEALKREGYRDVKAHVPARITDVDDYGRRLFYLDNGYGNFLALGYCTVYPSQVRLAKYARKVVARLVRMWMQADRRRKP